MMRRRATIVGVTLLIIVFTVLSCVSLNARDMSALSGIYSTISDSGLVARLDITGTFEEGMLLGKAVVGEKTLPNQIIVSTSPVYQVLPLQWISSTELLVDGRTIYDADNDQLSQIKTPLGFVSDYEVSPDKTLLALVGKNDSSGTVDVVVYDFKSQKTTTVHSSKPEWIGELDYQVAWDVENNLYFDSAVHEMPVIMVYTQDGIELFKQGGQFPVASPNGSVLTYRLADSVYYKECSEDPSIAVLKLDSGREHILNDDGRVDFGNSNNRLALVKPGGFSIYAVSPAITLLEEQNLVGGKAFFDLQGDTISLMHRKSSQDGSRPERFDTFQLQLQ